MDLYNAMKERKKNSVVYCRKTYYNERLLLLSCNNITGNIWLMMTKPKTNNSETFARSKSSWTVCIYTFMVCLTLKDLNDHISAAN